MKRAVLYTRVSTDEQAEKGFSLRFQQQQLEHYCTQKGYTIVQHFEEDYSAKNFTARPSFQKLLRYTKSHAQEVDIILFTKWDRFSRNIEASYRMIRTFREMDIEVNSTEQPLDLSQPDSKVMLAVYLVIPEVENDKNSIRTKDGLHRAKKEGCFTGGAPKGYKHNRTQDGKSTLKFDPEMAPLVKGAFERYAMEMYSAEEVRQYYVDKGLKISKNGFLALLKNYTYCGKIYIKPYRNEKSQLVEGLHPALISQELFDKVQLILKGKKMPRVRSLNHIDTQLPLRGFLACPKCGKTLTGSGSKGRGGKKTYLFYHCTRYCKTRFKAHEVNALFEKVLSECSLPVETHSIFKQLLSKRMMQGSANRQHQIKLLDQDKDKQLKRLEVAEDRFMDQVIDVETYQDIKIRIERELLKIKAKVKELNQNTIYFEKHLQEGVSFLADFKAVYENSSTAKKKNLLKALFPEKLVYQKHYFSTPKLHEAYKEILFRDKQMQYIRLYKNPFDTPMQDNCIKAS